MNSFRTFLSFSPSQPFCIQDVNFSQNKRLRRIIYIFFIIPSLLGTQVGFSVEDLRKQSYVCMDTINKKRLLFFPLSFFDEKLGISHGIHERTKTHVSLKRNEYYERI